MIKPPHFLSDNPSSSLQLSGLAQGYPANRSRISTSKFMRSSSFLTFKVMKTNPTFHETNSFDPKGLLNKYYGKKIFFIRSRADIPRLYHKSKYFTELKVKIGEQGKDHEVLRYYAPPLRQDKLMFEERSIMSGCPIYIDKTFYKRISSSGQEVIVPPQCRSLTSRLIKSTSTIKTLNLRIDAQEIVQCIRFLESLTSLEKIDISITHASSDEDESDYFLELCKLFNTILSAEESDDIEGRLPGSFCAPRILNRIPSVA